MVRSDAYIGLRWLTMRLLRQLGSRQRQRRTSYNAKRSARAFCYPGELTWRWRTVTIAPRC